jgi:hypothetical protein
MLLLSYRNVDLKTGYRTHNILCQPVRRSRGSGHIVAVLEMINKLEGQDFTTEDEELLATCAERVGDVLSDRFKELMYAGERFSGKLSLFSHVYL